MISLIINSYLTLFLSIGLASLVLFLMGSYFIYQHIFFNKNAAKNNLGHSVDFDTIAGDDVFATQLDLARAYIETGKKEFAKAILKTVKKQGSAAQQQEANRLLTENL